MGSIRIPAALNLVVGHRPTPGTYPAGNAAVPVSVTRDSIGVMARSMRDIAILDIVMRKSSAVTLSDIKSNQACASADIHTLRLGYPADWDKKVDDDVRGDFKAILKVLDAKLSIKMVAIPLPDLPATFSNALLKTYHDWSGVFTACELEPTLKAYLANKEGTSYAKVVAKLHGDDVKATFGYASYLATNGAEICKTSRVVRDHLIAYYASKLRTSAKPGDVDALIFPTVPIKAPKITDIKAGNFETVKLNAKLCAGLNGVPTPPPKPDANGKIDCRLGSVLTYFTDLPSLAGLPGLTLPSRHIGVGIDVNADNQHQLLPIGFALERLLPAPAP
jgi:mandelamide amidase